MVVELGCEATLVVKSTEQARKHSKSSKVTYWFNIFDVKSNGDFHHKKCVV